MLIYEQNRDILALNREAIKSSLNSRRICLRIHD